MGHNNTNSTKCNSTIVSWYAISVGMSTVFSISNSKFANEGCAIPVTILKILPGYFISATGKRAFTDSSVVNIGFGDLASKKRKMNKPQNVIIEKVGIPDDIRLIREVCVPDSFISNISSGESLDVDVFGFFSKLAFIDVIGTSKGKGFAGTMKRHNFSGGRASHGASLSHRSGGSTGQCQDMGRVVPGKKMAGHMGNDRVTIQNLSIVNVCERNKYLIVNGSVPGHKGAIVCIRNAKKKVVLYS